MPISIEILPNPINIPKFVALVLVVQRAIKIENIKTDHPASTASTPIIAIVLRESGVSAVKLLTAKNINAWQVIKKSRRKRFPK